MKLYLDDVREAPKGWVRCYWPSQVIQCLVARYVEEISLDHDLGDKEEAEREGRKERTGMDVLYWIQKEVVTNGFKPPKIHVHSNNAAAIRDMRNVIARIEELSA